MSKHTVNKEAKMKIVVSGPVESFDSKAQWLSRLRFEISLGLAFSQREKEDEWAMTSQIFSSPYLSICLYSFSLTISFPYTV